MKTIILVILVLLLMSFTQDDKTVTYQYLGGTEVTLTATPDSGWVFMYWSGDIEGNENPITITMTQDMEVTAHFFPCYGLKINTVGAGRVDSDPDSDCNN